MQRNTIHLARTEAECITPDRVGDITEVIDYETDESGALLAFVRLASRPGRVTLVDALDVFVGRAA
jgi:hypothetical protein